MESGFEMAAEALFNEAQKQLGVAEGWQALAAGTEAEAERASSHAEVAREEMMSYRDLATEYTNRAKDQPSESKLGIELTKQAATYSLYSSTGDGQGSLAVSEAEQRLTSTSDALTKKQQDHRSASEKGDNHTVSL
jgi:hypothetical protein